MSASLAGGTKRCSKCAEKKSFEDFYKCRTNADGLQNICIACQKIKTKAYFATEAGRASGRRAQRKRNTGFFEADFEGRWASQEGLCVVCQSSLRTGVGGASADHCHETSRLRGVLCFGCNTSLGRMKDDPALLISAVGYLIAHGHAYPTETLEAAIARHSAIISRYREQPPD